jgi:hypothetical protein
MRNLKRMGLLMGIPLCAILFYACTQDIPDEAGSPSFVPGENDGGEPEGEPITYDVSITLTHTVSMSTLDKTYTPEDFPELPSCKLFKNLLIPTPDLLLGYERNGLEYKRKFQARVRGREQVINEVLRLLNEREDIESADKFVCLDAETKRQVQQAFWDDYVIKNPNTKGTMEILFPILRYYGTYNGCVVILPHDNVQADDFPISVTIDGIQLEERPPGMHVWKDGSIYIMQKHPRLNSMTDLYEEGRLTREDLLTIAGIKERMSEDLYFSIY